MDTGASAPEAEADDEERRAKASGALELLWPHRQFREPERLPDTDPAGAVQMAQSPESETEFYLAQLQSAALPLWGAAAEDKGTSHKDWTAVQARVDPGTGCHGEPVRRPLRGLPCVSEWW